MDLILFVIFLIVSLIFIALAFWHPEHSELGVIGFVILFFLGSIILSSSIQYKIGVDTNTTYTYECFECSQTFSPVINSTSEISRDVYASITADSNFSHWAGLLLLLGAIGGLIGIVPSIQIGGRKK